MSELIKIIKHFITRDVIFIIGGSIVILSFMYKFNRISITNLPTAYYILGAGISYVLGYTIQDAFCLLPFVKIKTRLKYNTFIQKLYKIFVGEDGKWELLKTINLDDARREIDKQGGERIQAQLERIITLKQIGMTIGSCGLISSIFLILRAIEYQTEFDVWLASCVFLVSIILILLGWIKMAQAAHYYTNFYLNLKRED